MMADMPSYLIRSRALRVISTTLPRSGGGGWGLFPGPLAGGGRLALGAGGRSWVLCPFGGGFGGGGIWRGGGPGGRRGAFRRGRFPPPYRRRSRPDPCGQRLPHGQAWL